MGETSRSIFLCYSVVWHTFAPWRLGVLALMFFYVFANDPLQQLCPYKVDESLFDIKRH